MGSGSGTAWPTRVGPNTRARFWMSILVSTLRATLVPKELKKKTRIKSSWNVFTDSFRRILDVYLCKWITRKASVSLLGWGNSLMVWYNMARQFPSSWISTTIEKTHRCKQMKNSAVNRLMSQQQTFSKPKSCEPGLLFFRAVLLLICSNKPYPVENQSF